MKLSTGLVDKMCGVRSNMFTNGAFTSGTTGWSTTSSSGTLTSEAGGQAGNCLQVANAGAASGDAYQDVTTVVGRTHRLSFYFKKGTSASGYVKVGTPGSPASIYSGPALTDASFTYYEMAFMATATTTRVSFVNTSTTSGHTSLWDTLVLDAVYDGVRDIMHLSKINVYKGTQPADPNTQASAGNLLEVICRNGTSGGLIFSEASNGVLSIPAGDTWRTEIGVNITQSGDASWFRCYEAGDDPHTDSTTAARFDGTCGTSGADMIVGQLARTAGLIDEITACAFTIPKGW